MKTPHYLTGLFAIFATILFGLSACNDKNQNNVTTTSEVHATSVDGKRKEVNIYNWSDYVDPSTIKDFENKTGIKVNYSVYDSNESLQGKLLIGNSGFDLVGPGNIFLARQISAHIYQPLMKSKIPNYKNIDPQLLKLMEAVDPGNKYAVPYFWGINTLGINREKVAKALDGPLPENEWELIFNPEYAKKLQSCGISVLDSPSEVYPLVWHYLGIKSDGKNIKDIETATEAMLKIRPFIKRFNSSGYIDDLARGELCLVLGYGGDLNIARNRAKEAENGVVIDVLVPRTGVAIWIDSLAIPADAKNVDEALAYINHTLDPKIAARNGNMVTYAPGSKPARERMEAQYASNPSIFLSDELFKVSFLNIPLDIKTTQKATELWNKMKKASTEKSK